MSEYCLLANHRNYKTKLWPSGKVENTSYKESAAQAFPGSDTA